MNLHTRYCAAFVALSIFLGCSNARTDTKQDEPQKPASVLPVQRFVPVGANPELALDTQTGMPETEKDTYEFQRARVIRLGSELGKQVEFDETLTAIKFKATDAGKQFKRTPHQAS